MPVASAEERLQSLLMTLEDCRQFLIDESRTETARLLSLAILELRMELHQVTDAELKALCDLMTPEDDDAPPPEKGGKASPAKGAPTYLRLIK